MAIYRPTVKSQFYTRPVAKDAPHVGIINVGRSAAIKCGKFLSLRREAEAREAPLNTGGLWFMGAVGNAAGVVVAYGGPWGGGGCITWLLGYRRDPSCEGSAARGVSPCNASERSCRRFEARVSLLVGGGKDLEKREISERERESITNPGNPKLRRRAGESRMFIRH